jgi:hypothetical protein
MTFEMQVTKLCLPGQEGFSLYGQADSVEDPTQIYRQGRVDAQLKKHLRSARSGSEV